MSNLSFYEKKFVYQKTLSLKIGAYNLRFDCSQAHEKRYIIRHIFDCLYPQADIDQKLFGFFVKKGDVCLDLGANIGVTALEMIGAGAKKVLAFEPYEPHVIRLSNIKCDAIEVYPIAVSDHIGKADMFISKTHNQGNTIVKGQVNLFPKVFGDHLKTETVSVRTLDSLLSETNTDVWKIDVEGSENALIRGAIETLKKKPPRVIICECYNCPHEILNLLGGEWTGLRALLRIDNYELVFSRLSEKIVSRYYHKTSPMYVFFRKDSIDLISMMQGFSTRF